MAKMGQDIRQGGEVIGREFHAAVINCKPAVIRVHNTERFHDPVDVRITFDNGGETILLEINKTAALFLAQALAWASR